MRTSRRRAVRLLPLLLPLLLLALGPCPCGSTAGRASAPSAPAQPPLDDGHRHGRRLQGFVGSALGTAAGAAGAALNLGGGRGVGAGRFRRSRVGAGGPGAPHWRAQVAANRLTTTQQGCNLNVVSLKPQNPFKEDGLSPSKTLYHLGRNTWTKKALAWRVMPENMLSRAMRRRLASRVLRGRNTLIRISLAWRVMPENMLSRAMRRRPANRAWQAKSLSTHRPRVQRVVLESTLSRATRRRLASRALRARNMLTRLAIARRVPPANIPSRAMRR